MKVLIIDNGDSYSYNLKDLVWEVMGQEPDMLSAEDFDIELVKAYDNLILASSSENNPDIYEVIGQVVQAYKKPVLAVGTGAIALYNYLGQKICQAASPGHGLTVNVSHQGQDIFTGLKDDFQAMIYNSHFCEDGNSEDVEVLARDGDGRIMAFRKKDSQLYGVQFHPESIGSQESRPLMENFLRLSGYIPREDIHYKKISLDLGAEEVFHRLNHEYPGVQWLDSSAIIEDYSRFSIFGMTNEKKGYIVTYWAEENQVQIQKQGGLEIIEDMDIFQYFSSKIRCRKYKNLPFEFQLGYIGYFGYGAQNKVPIERYGQGQPDALFQYIDRAVVIDHLEKELYILSALDDSWYDEVQKVLQKEVNYKKKPVEKEPIQAYFNLGKEAYKDRIEEVIALIEAGEVWQLCMTNMLNLDISVDPVDYYIELRKASPAPYSALLRFGDISICSSSMERFITVDLTGKAESKPIKGTVRRGADPAEDQRLIEELSKDDKTFAENMIILDLLRNDFSKVCRPGTVRVPKLMEVETYSTLHQLVSTVTGQIKEAYHPIELFKAAIPGGSMTGSPKKRAVELLNELETWDRGIYSGSIGYVSRTGAIDFNIVIRTAIIQDQKVTMGLGGAITGLSDPEEEYEEMLLKAKGLLMAFKAYFDTEEIEWREKC